MKNFHKLFSIPHDNIHQQNMKFQLYFFKYVFYNFNPLCGDINLKGNKKTEQKQTQTTFLTQS